MTAVAEQHEAYVSHFAGLARESANGQPFWLRDIRQRALQHFEELGFPTTRNEEWKFTSVGPIARTRFQRASADQVLVGLDRSVAGVPPHLVFVNGIFFPALSAPSLPAGVKVSSLKAALESGNPLVEEHLARYAGYQDHGFVALNTASLEDGAFIEIPEGRIVEHPIHLLFLSAANGTPSICHPRNLIVAGPDTQAAIVETYAGQGNQIYFNNVVTEIVAGENSVIDYYKLQQESEAAFHIARLQVEQRRGANFTSHCISFGGALVRNEINTVLSEGSESTLNGLYVVNGRQHVDNHTTIDHAEPHATSHELYKGILDGKSSAVFNGRIIVRKDAQKTDAKQTNKNLVLSEDAVIDTKPQLQIYANDVRCTHGATIGQLDEEAIFYLRSRGIGRREARDLLTYAFARDIIDRVRVEAIREHLERALFARFSRRQEAI